jgi:glycosyltransferase involved in cell wall biosynthesis/predicted metal-dependent phosphoesterase TrpH
MISTTTKVDMHCHSTASERSKLGVQRSLGMPECATPPQEVYELAKRRGMDFVTVTDHDTIEGCLELADRDDCFISEELTAWFPGESHAVHVLCYGITPEDHEWLQGHSSDVESCAAYLHEREIACALAHPFYSVEQPLEHRHRRRLAELFPIWEVRNGSRAGELNMPAAVYIDTHGGTGIGGSDDHAGVDIGRTFTETPAAGTPEEFLRLMRGGEAAANGKQGSAAKWAHSAIALGVRALAVAGKASDNGGSADHEDGAAPDPASVFRIAERVMREGGARSGADSLDLGPEHARALLGAWLASMDFGSGEELIAQMQADDFSHSELARRARRIHERVLGDAVTSGVEAVGRGEYGPAAAQLFAACLPIVPYVTAAAFLASEKARLTVRDGEPPRIAIVADGIGAMHGVTHTLEQIRERGVPGYEVEVIGTDPRVDRRLPAAAEVEVPFYEGLRIGFPDLPAVVDALADGRYDAVHLTSPGPSCIAAGLIARIMGLPIVGSHHTDFTSYTALRSGDPALAQGVTLGLGVLFGACTQVLSPGPAADRTLTELGIEPQRIGRWQRGVDTVRFSPAKRDTSGLPGGLRVLYAGRLTKEKGVDLLAESFLRARRFDPRLHLILAGGGPEEAELKSRIGEHATFLGWLGGEDLARAYASADIFLFCSSTDTYGQAIVEAQASGLPVVAVGIGGPASLIDDRETGLLCPADPERLAGAVLLLAESPPLRRRLATAALAAARTRPWEAAMEQLAAGYERALDFASDDQSLGAFARAA